jgi:glucose/arabinose dehydrogenase
MVNTMAHKLISILFFCVLSASFSAAALAARILDPIPSVITKGNVTISLKTAAKGYVTPVTATYAPKDKNHLFVVEQNGKIWSVQVSDDQGHEGRTKRLFANLGSFGLNLGCFGINYDERGLLGLAFHPNYRKNGLVYTYQSRPNSTSSLVANQCDLSVFDHDNVVTEWKVKKPGSNKAKIDLSSGREVLREAHPQFNHNGGELRFGPDGMLYISIGDGGNADDQDTPNNLNSHSLGGNAQDLNKLQGKILRIDPLSRSGLLDYKIPDDNPFINTLGARGEIWAYGFRNPYKMSFDVSTGKLYVADVGQNDVEEIDIVERGGNYGWPVKEGTFAFDQNGAADGFVTDVALSLSGPFVDPIAEYDHNKEGIAIVGGFIYRGRAIKKLRGHYVFGNYSTDFNTSNGRLFYLDNQNQAKEFRIGRQAKLGMSVLGIGQDARGELYVLGKSGATSGNIGITDTKNKSGVVMKLVPHKSSGGKTSSPNPTNSKPTNPNPTSPY